MRFGWLPLLASLGLASVAPAATVITSRVETGDRIVFTGYSEPDAPGRDHFLNGQFDVLDGRQRAELSVGADLLFASFELVTPYFLQYVDYSAGFRDEYFATDCCEFSSVANSAGAIDTFLGIIRSASFDANRATLEFDRPPNELRVFSLDPYFSERTVYRPQTLFIDAELASRSRVDFELVITAVPEPATWAMLILGFGAVGTALRRTRLSHRERIRSLGREAA